MTLPPDFSAKAANWCLDAIQSPSGCGGIVDVGLPDCVERMNRLYEQGADFVCIGDYVRRWRQWVQSGLDG